MTLDPAQDFETEEPIRVRLAELRRLSYSEAGNLPDAEERAVIVRGRRSSLTTFVRKLSSGDLLATVQLSQPRLGGTARINIERGLIFGAQGGVREATDEENIPPHIVKGVGAWRFVGWWFLVLGLIMSVWPIAVLFDPDAAMPVNGVPHKDFPTKLAVAAFVLIAPCIGALLALTPRRKLEVAFTSIDRFLHRTFASHLGK